MLKFSLIKCMVVYISTSALKYIEDNHMDQTNPTQRGRAARRLRVAAENINKIYTPYCSMSATYSFSNTALPFPPNAAASAATAHRSIIG